MNISSFLIGYQAAKNAGGGSSADVRYVTFMSYDGTEEHGRIPVAVGYDCPNPKFTPTRESTAQYNFVHDAWATEPNGATDANALKAVTEDRAVYATFISVLRSYTITFCDEDGTTLNSNQWTYGTTPSYTPKKDGFDFVGWTPEPVAVTGDASYTAVWKIKATFETATWEQIAAICADGTYADTFAIGDTKPVTLTYDDGTSETINFTIVDMDVDPISSTEKAPLTLMAENIVSISPTKLASKYNLESTNFYGNDLAENILGRIYSAFPSELQAVITPLRYSWNIYPNVFVAHSVNLGVPHTGWNGKADTPVYNAEYKHFANGASIKRTKLNDATYDDYWTSARCDYSSSSYTSAYYVAIDGETKVSSKESANGKSHGIVPCFCIGR